MAPSDANDAVLDDIKQLLVGQRAGLHLRHYSKTYRGCRTTALTALLDTGLRKPQRLLERMSQGSCQGLGLR
jgi:hypothetical protein